MGSKKEITRSQKWKKENLHRFNNGIYIKNEYPKIIPIEGEIFKYYKTTLVSNFGRTFNKYGKQVGTGIAKGNGYHYIKNKKRSRIVYELFKGPIPEGLVINHIDGNKINDHIDNLEAITMGENNKHAYETGLKNPLKKYSDEQFVEIFELMIGGKNNQEIAKIVNIKIKYICDIRHGYKLGTNRTKLYNLYKDRIPQENFYYSTPREVILNVLKDIYHTDLSNCEIAKKHNIKYCLVQSARTNTRWVGPKYNTLRELAKNEK